MKENQKGENRGKGGNRAFRRRTRSGLLLSSQLGPCARGLQGALLTHNHASHAQMLVASALGLEPPGDNSHGHGSGILTECQRDDTHRTHDQYYQIFQVSKKS